MKADGGTTAGSAAAFDELNGKQAKHAAAAFDGVHDSCAAEADFGRDLSEVAATDFEGAGVAVAAIAMGDNGSTAVAFSGIESEDAPNSEVHGQTATVLGAVEVLHALSVTARICSIRGSFHNSLHHHTIHVHAPSRLASVPVGLGVGVGTGVRAGVGCVGSLEGDDERMDACMEGTTPDGIHAVTNSTIRSFTEYHDDSCARLNASINSRVAPIKFRRNKAFFFRYWTQVEKTERPGLWWFPGALRRQEIFLVLCAAVDWVRKGSSHTALSVSSTS